MDNENVNFSIILIRNKQKTQSNFENRSSVDLSINDEFTVTIQTQLGTGYRWILENDSMSTVQLKSEKVLSEDEEVNQVGQFQHQTFHFKAIKEGEERIRLKYGRVWEKNKNPQKTIFVDLKVKNIGDNSNG